MMYGMHCLWRVIPKHGESDSTTSEKSIYSTYHVFLHITVRLKTRTKYAKNADMTKIQKKHIFFIFRDMIVWFKVGGNTSFGVILDAI